MHLSGQLGDWTINDLLQIMQVTQKTGSLDIDGDRRGRVHFREGSVTGAELTGVKGSYLGGDRAGVADIIYVLSTVDAGSFSVGPADGPETDGWEVEDVLADVEALQSLEGEVVDAGLFEATGVRLVKNIAEPMTIDPEDWSVLVSLVQPFTFSRLETALGRGSAVRTFHTLHRLGVAEAVVDGEDESEWLDRLAEDIAPGSGEPTWLEHVPEDGLEEEPEDQPEPVTTNVVDIDAEVKGVSAPASTTLTDGVYDEIRRLRSKVVEQ